jgi:CheY-like chemotaxis protein
MNPHLLNYLVVDDLELMRAVTVNQLRGMGYEKIKVARNGAEALEMLRAFKFDAVLSDWNMPVMNGLELLKAVRAECQTGQTAVFDDHRRSRAPAHRGSDLGRA